MVLNARVRTHAHTHTGAAELEDTRTHEPLILRLEIVERLGPGEVREQPKSSFYSAIKKMRSFQAKGQKNNVWVN